MSLSAGLVMVAIGLSALSLTAVSTFDVPPWLLYNPSPSAPKGLYRVRHSGTLKVGDMVAARVPEPMRSLVVERGYLPRNVPVMKRIVAAEGDHVCFRGGMVHLNLEPLVRPLDADSLGRPMPVWKGCRALVEGEFFLAMTDVPASFDSRYFGPVRRDDVLGLVEPLAFIFRRTAFPTPPMCRVLKCHQTATAAGRQDKSNAAMGWLSRCLHIMFLTPCGTGDITPFSGASLAAPGIAGESLFRNPCLSMG